jgi:hypothetical protein
MGAYLAFDGNPNTYWSSANVYNNSTGVYDGATVTVSGTKSWRGEWLQIQFPPVTVHSIFRPIALKLTPRSLPEYHKYRSPRKFVLLGSQASNVKKEADYGWEVLFDNTGVSQTGVIDWTTETKTIQLSTVSNGYRYYRLVVTQVGMDYPKDAKIIKNIIGTSGVTIDTIVTDQNPLDPQKLYYMVGECTPAGGKRITNARYLADGRVVYMLEDGGYTKMVTNDAEARYYTGAMTTFNPTNWSTYTLNGKGKDACYKLSICHSSCTSAGSCNPEGACSGSSPLMQQSNVQITEMRIVGTPIVDDPTKPQVPEMIPCTVDCRYGDWQNSCVYEDQKWKQKRSKTDAIYDGVECSQIEGGKTERACPNIATNWSEWGAFKNANGTPVGSGTTDQFKPRETYTDSSVVKQVRYIKPTGVQGCPSNIAPNANGLCLEVRDVYGAWGDCKLINNKWQKERTNVISGTPDYLDCSPEQKWQDFGDYPFLVQSPTSGLYLEVGAKGWHRGRQGVPTAYAGMTGRGDNTYQLFRKGARTQYPNFIWTNDGRYVWDALGWDKLQNPNGASGQWDSLNSQYWDGKFQFDPNTNMIRNADSNRCFESNGADWVYFRACNVNNANQRFKVIPQ